MLFRHWKGLLGAGALVLCVGSLAGPASAASFFGLSTGDTISALTYDTPLTGVTYTNSTNVLHVEGAVTSIVSSAGVLSEIGGGMFVVDFNIVSETLTDLGGGIFDYSATLAGIGGTTDIQLFAPTCPGPGCTFGPGGNDPENDGFDPEQDGRLLITGDFNLGAVTLTSTIDSASPTQSFALQGLFSTTGGDAQFRQVYGDTGAVSFVGAGVDNFSPALFGGLLNPPPGGTDTEVFNSNFTAHSSGQVIPLGGAPFQPVVPEPSSIALLGLGLGWLGRRGLRK